MTIERRHLAEPIELRGEKGSLVAAGYGIVYNKLSSNLGGFVERALPGLANKTMKEQDILGLFNHDASMVIGRQSSGTLRMGSDDTGVWYEIDLPETSLGRDLAVMLERGDVNGSSFGFRVLEDEWDETEQGFPMRSLKQIIMRDIGPVTFPAYPDSTSALRSFAEARSLEVDAVIKAAQANDLISLMKRSTEEETEESDSEESQAKPTLSKSRLGR